MSHQTQSRIANTSQSVKHMGQKESPALLKERGRNIAGSAPSATSDVPMACSEQYYDFFTSNWALHWSVLPWLSVTVPVKVNVSSAEIEVPFHFRWSCQRMSFGPVPRVTRAIPARSDPLWFTV